MMTSHFRLCNGTPCPPVNLASMYNSLFSVQFSIHTVVLTINFAKIMASSRMCHRKPLDRTGISEERIASIIRVERIGDPVHPSGTSALANPHCVTFQKMAFFRVTAVIISNLI
jgi:hypothetical protein